MRAVVLSLEQFKIARDDAAGMSKAKEAQELFTSIEIADSALKCAAKMVGGYKNPKQIETNKTNPSDADQATEDAVQLTIEGIDNTSQGLLILNESVKNSMVAELNGENKAEKPGDKASRMAKLGVNYRDTWDLLMIVSASACATLVEYNPKTNTAERLNITAAERTTLNKQLIAAFPEITRKNTDNLPPVESAALIIYHQINKKGWKTHEQPFSGS